MERQSPKQPVKRDQAAAAAPGCGQIRIQISPTTGGDFHLTVDQDLSVDGLRKLVSKKLRVPRDRICLLFRDKQLQDGNLTQHGITDESRVTLLPNVETGLITQRPEIGIMQALESLNETQVNEFLCGKAPLNLSMRLGDHMMLIQLQLSTVPNAGSSGSSSSSSSGIASSSSRSASTSSTASQPLHHHHDAATAAAAERAASPQHPQQQQQPSAMVPRAPPPPPSLLQASRNLQHTLRRLSADVFSGRDRGRHESVYSGTFSGALNPALQDPKGRPRRDVATIVHILNDLLCSVPELRRVTRRCSGVSSAEPLAPASQDSLMDGKGASAASASSTSAPSDFSNFVDDQLSKTRGKLEHLRLVMGQRRERRRQRKQKPYPPIQPSPDTDTVTA